MNKKSILRTLLLAGSIYFTSVALVHFLGIKIPVLYIYYDIPSNAYQDRIISVLCFAFAIFLFAGYKIFEQNFIIVKYIVLAGFVAVLGLYVNNFISAENLKTNLIYWLEITILAIYLVFLFIFMKIQSES